MSVKLIFNPAASKGAALRMKDIIEDLLRKNFSEYSVDTTLYPGHATHLARDALKNGFATVIAAGGDGTINEVVNGFFDGDKPINIDAKLGLFPIGLGNDYIKSFCDKTKPELSVKCIIDGKSKLVDVGSVEYTTYDGGTSERKFINIADFGLSSEVASWVNTHKQIKSGTMAYFIGTMAAWRKHRECMVRLVVDGSDKGSHKLHLGLICIGTTFGGGMEVAPNAVTDDSLFDVYFAKKMNFFGVLKKLPKVYLGKHIEDKDVMYFRASSVEVYPEGEKRVLMAMEGEQPGFLPAKYKIIPKSLRICA